MLRTSPQAAENVVQRVECLHNAHQVVGSRAPRLHTVGTDGQLLESKDKRTRGLRSPLASCHVLNWLFIRSK